MCRGLSRWSLSLVSLARLSRSRSRLRGRSHSLSLSKLDMDWHWQETIMRQQQTMAEMEEEIGRLALASTSGRSGAETTSLHSEHCNLYLCVCVCVCVCVCLCVCVIANVQTCVCMCGRMFEMNGQVTRAMIERVDAKMIESVDAGLLGADDIEGRCKGRHQRA